MNRKKFVAIFKMLLIDVAGLSPKKRRMGGLKIYSSEEDNAQIPVIIVKSEMRIWLEALGPKTRESVEKTFEGRIAMISSTMLRLTNKLEETFDYRYQLVLNTKALRGLVSHAKKNYVTLNLKMDRSLFIEAMFVAYICHELRHLVQLFVLEAEDFHSNFKKIPALSNNNVSHCKLKRFWFSEITYQMGLYRVHYAIHTTRVQRGFMFKMEKDALFVQLLSLDCWMNSSLSYDEKILKLQEILLSKKER
jgi:hypothetical protein